MAEQWLQCTEDDFVKGKPIGSGATGHVYECKLRKNMGRYALKEVWLLQNTEEQKKLLKESFAIELEILRKMK